MNRKRGREAIGVISGVSPHNFSDDIRADMDLPKQVIVNDLTLREGRQIEGIVLSVDECVRIARQLDELGVPMIQLMNVLNRAPYEDEYLKAISKLGLKMKMEALTPPPFTMQLMKESIDRLFEYGVRPIVTLALSDDILRSVGKSKGNGDKPLKYLKEQTISFGVEVVQYARSRGDTINVNLQDFMRCDLDYMERMCRELAKAGVGIIVLDDIAGPALPAVYKYCVRKAKKAVPDIPIGIHVHNDYALALAGVLGALEGGAEVLDCGVNGYGERAGHAELAQLVVILEFLYGYDTGIRLEKLTETARLVADIMRQPLPKSMPIVGENAFSHVSDWHWQHEQYPWITASLLPDVVGNVTKPIFGEWPGPFGLRLKAKALGITIPDEKIGAVLGALREQMRWLKRPLTDAEFLKVVER